MYTRIVRAVLTLILPCALAPVAAWATDVPSALPATGEELSVSCNHDPLTRVVHPKARIESALSEQALKSGSEPDSGYCGDNGYQSVDADNVSYYYDRAGTLTLTGAGSTGFYSENNTWGSFTVPVPGWHDYRSSITNVVIGYGW